MVNEMRSRRRQVSLKPSQSPQWNKILAVLEMLQTKKGITSVNLLIAPLFDLLKHCLNEDEQAPLEYSKQLILSCLLTCCQKLSPGLSISINQKERNKKCRGKQTLLKCHLTQLEPSSLNSDSGLDCPGDIVKLASEFKTGGIVQCIRVSNNPQTHHQALLLLSLAAELFPSQVLTNIMEIFTFMGTSVLRQDDAYSFQVIAKTLESVIPTLIEASKKTAVEPVVTTVVHVFADALPEVPEHRRIAVFDKLMTTLDPEVYLWLAPTLILSNMATQGPRLGKMLIKEEDSKDRMAADVEFSLNVCHLYQPRVQLKACIRMMEYLHSLPLEKQVQRTPSATSVDMTEGSVPFSLDIHTTRQLCNFKLFLVNFISTLLSSNQLIERLVELDEKEKLSLEELYRHLIEVALKYTQSMSRVVDQPLASTELGPNPKFWRALLHRCYDVIDRYVKCQPSRLASYCCTFVTMNYGRFKAGSIAWCPFNHVQITNGVSVVSTRFSVPDSQDQQLAPTLHVHLGGAQAVGAPDTFNPSQGHGTAERQITAPIEFLRSRRRRAQSGAVDSTFDGHRSGPRTE